MRVIAIAVDDSLVGHLDDQNVDVVLSLGDLWDNSLSKARDRYLPNAVMAVRGNHDTDAPFEGFVDPLHFTIKEYGGLTFGGFDGSWKYKPKGHHLYEQDEVSRMLRAFPRVDVFVAHNSPWGIHQRDLSVHQGFKAFLEYIERTKPSYFIHGHQHLNRRTKHGETEVIAVFGEKLLEI